MNFAVIILNYYSFKDTITCVQNFLSQKTEDEDNLDIIIVDNGSKNESVEELHLALDQFKNVKIFSLENNLGFAKGNNYGYNQLNKDYYDFVIVSNDDILLKGDNIFHWIKREYEKYHFSVLGPDIFSLSEKAHTNPNPNKSLDYKKMWILLKKLQLKYLLIKFNPFDKTKEKYFNSEGMFDKHKTDITLHGAFQIFSKQYFNFYSEPYNDQTFLYMEEDLLRLRCIQHNLVLLYSPDFRVDHIQETATNIITKNNYRKKLLFRLSHQIESFKIYLKELKKINKNYRRK